MATTSSLSIAPTLSRNDFPRVRWWHEQHWTQSKDITNPEGSDDDEDPELGNTKTKKAVAYLEEQARGSDL